MAQDNASVVTPQSLSFMSKYPPPTNAYENDSGSAELNTLRPPPPLPPPPAPSPFISVSQGGMTQVRQNQWIHSQWIPPPGHMGQMPPMRPLRPMRPRRRADSVMYPRHGPQMWRVNRYSSSRSGRDNYNPMRKPRGRFQNPQHNADKQCINLDGTSMEKPKLCKLNGLPAGDANSGMNVSVKVEKMEETKTTVTEKCLRKVARKRKPISEFYPTKPWNRQDAEKALKVELEAYKKQVQTLIIKFPDPVLSWDIIKSYHSAIEKVHFQVPSGPRYCFIQLSDDSNVDQVIEELKEVEFHNLGKIKVEKKFEKPDGNVEPESIDPYTLYIGNLPLAINASLIKEKFPTSARIDVGYAQKMKYTRYAFVRYQTVEESIEAFKSSHNVMFDSRNLIVRFRRHKGKNSMAIDLGSKSERREKLKIIECKRHLEDLRKIVEKKHKKEKLEPGENYEPTLSDIIGRSGNSDDEQESEEEKEVDDDDDDDDDDEDETDYLEEWKEENFKIELGHKNSGQAAADEENDAEDDDENDDDDDDDDDDDEEEDDEDDDEEEEEEEDDDKEDEKN